MNDDITNYPLYWPANQPRTDRHQRRHARFVARGRTNYATGLYSPNRKHTIAEGARELELEIKRMGGKNMIISTNLKVKSNGLPSIHMPREACRILLEIVQIRVERVANISRTDALAEGIDTLDDSVWYFSNLWNSINKTKGKAFNDNPWVWVIEFKVVDPIKPKLIGESPITTVRRALNQEI